MSVNSISGLNLTAAQTALYTGKNSAAAADTESKTAQANVDTFTQTSSADKTEDQESVQSRNAALVNQLKADLETQKSRLLDTVRNMLTKQGRTAAEGDGIWKQIAGGNFQVDPETQAAAKEAISDGGYWSVEKTSERLVKYAKALVGGDPSKAEAMREAFVKGFKAAEKAWGGTLPDISQKTYDATMKLFDEWANEANA